MSEFANPHDLWASNASRIDGDHAILEQAKGALMLRYGIGSHEAFALLLTWSRDSGATLHTIADTLVSVVVRQSGEAEHRPPELVHWLKEQLSSDIPGESLTTSVPSPAR